MLALKLPTFLIFDESWIYFFSISRPFSANSLEISAEVTDPKSLSPSRDFAEIFKFKKSIEKDDIIKTYRKKSEFIPKSVQRQQKIKDKLRKSRENGKG